MLFLFYSVFESSTSVCMDTEGSEAPKPRFGVDVKWLIPLSACGACFCNVVTSEMGVSVLPTFLESIHIPAKWYYVQLAAQPAFEIVANMFSGLLVDRGDLSAQSYLLCGLGGLACGTGLTTLSLCSDRHPQWAYAALLTARCIQGLSSSFIMPAGMAWIAQTHTNEELAMGQGTALLGIALGYVSGPGPAGLLAGCFGLSSPYWAVVAVLMLNMSLVGIINVERIEDDIKASKKDQPNFFSQLQNVYILSLNLTIYLINVTSMAMMAGVGPYVVATFRWDPLKQGLMWLPACGFYVATRSLCMIFIHECPAWILPAIGVVISSGGLSIATLNGSRLLLISGLSLNLAGLGLCSTPSLLLLGDMVKRKMTTHGNGQVFAMAQAVLCLGMASGPMVAALPLPFPVACQIHAVCTLFVLIPVSQLCSYPVDDGSDLSIKSSPPSGARSAE